MTKTLLAVVTFCNIFEDPDLSSKPFVDDRFSDVTVSSSEESIWVAATVTDSSTFSSGARATAREIKRQGFYHL